MDETTSIQSLIPPEQLQQRIASLLEQQHLSTAHLSDEHLKHSVTEIVDQAIQELTLTLPETNYQIYRHTLLDELLGLGPLEKLLQDESITEIMVNHYQEVYVERAGKIMPHTLNFTSEQALRHIVERIVAPLGRRIDEASPIVDARLPNGARVHIIIPPLALDGTALTIRKFPQKPINVQTMLENGTLNQLLLEYLQQSVIQEKNILISGGTGAGKTTLLNLLSAFIPESSRVITIEEAAELRLQLKHLLRLEARPPNSEGKGEITIRELLRNALRMRPDRIIIGECRGAEALDMLQAMNTGHAGSLTTLHANSPRDALTRIETMVMMAGLPLSSHAIRSQIASAIDIVIQIKRCIHGQRIISEIHEIIEFKENEISTQCKFHSKIEANHR